MVFKSLTRENLGEIVGIELHYVSDLLPDHGLRPEINPAAKAWLTDMGLYPQLGARPLKHAIQREIQDPLAHKQPNSEFSEGDTIKIDQTNTSLSFTKG